MKVVSMVLTMGERTAGLMVASRVFYSAEKTAADLVEWKAGTKDS